MDHKSPVSPPLFHFVSLIETDKAYLQWDSPETPTFSSMELKNVIVLFTACWINCVLAVETMKHDAEPNS